MKISVKNLKQYAKALNEVGSAKSSNPLFSHVQITRNGWTTIDANRFYTVIGLPASNDGAPRMVRLSELCEVIKNFKGASKSVVDVDLVDGMIVIQNGGTYKVRTIPHTSDDVSIVPSGLFTSSAPQSIPAKELSAALDYVGNLCFGAEEYRHYLRQIDVRKDGVYGTDGHRLQRHPAVPQGSPLGTIPDYAVSVLRPMLSRSPWIDTAVSDTKWVRVVGGGADGGCAEMLHYRRRDDEFPDVDTLISSVESSCRYSATFRALDLRHILSGRPNNCPVEIDHYHGAGDETWCFTFKHGESGYEAREHLHAEQESNSGDTAKQLQTAFNANYLVEACDVEADTITIRFGENLDPFMVFAGLDLRAVVMPMRR